MGPAPHLIFPGALLGSVVIAFLGFLFSAGFSLPTSAATVSDESVSALAMEGTTQFLPSIASSAVEQIEPGQEESQLEETTAESAVEHRASSCDVSERYPDKVRQWCELITMYARNHELDPDLIAALIWQESGGNPLAYSRSGAVGLMQVMPRDGIASTFMCKNGPCFTNRPSIEELQDPEFNIQYGTRMLAGLLGRYGNMRDALKYYGPMDVGYYYADKVLGIYQNYRK